MSTPPLRVLLHLGRDRRRAVDPEDIYFLEAVGETTLVRLRSARRVRDVRLLGDLLKVLAGAGLVRVHRNHAVNVRHVLEVRRRSAQRGWEVKLEPPVNRVLPAGRTYLRRLWAAFGEGALCLIAVLLASACTRPPEPVPASGIDRPNVVLIVTDDMGYADMGTQGATDIRTPNLDRMAAEGTRFTSFYVAQPVCTASRAAFLSGSYPNRVGLQGALNHTSRNGIHPDEWLLPEMFKARGYATSGMGKWHLGTVARFGATRNGFDEWLGIPYSNDNSSFHPVLSAEMPPLPFYDGEEIIETDPDQSQFTKRFTERAVSFIERNAEGPFFLYMPHVMPHVPIFASERFIGRSEHGLYGDVIEELDWSVGEILATLERLGIDDKTLVIFFSDNGPWLSYGEHAGSATPFREGKLTTFEGGVRVPFLVRWPGQVPAGRVSDEPFMSIDLLPTLTELVGGTRPELKIDGLSVKPLLLGEPSATSPHEALFFYGGTELQAVRSGRWKLHFAHPYITTAAEPGRGGKPSNWGKNQAQSITQSGIEGIASRHGGRIEQLELSLYDLHADPGESTNVAAQHPDVVARLSRLADPMRDELGDSLNGIVGTEVRAAGWEEPPPLP